LARLAKADLLILDDLGLGTPTEAHRHDLLEMLEDRYGRSSTVVTGQLRSTKWHEWIGDPTPTDAILDRLVHNAYKQPQGSNQVRRLSEIVPLVCGR
jgi:DNA replication protein DnaC